MRTTLNLDDDVYELVAQEASRRRLSFGQTVSQLVRKGAQIEARFVEENGIVVAELPEDSPTVDMELVRKLENEP